MSNLDLNSQAVLEKLLLENLKEAQRKRRCGFSKLLLIILVMLLISLFSSTFSSVGNLTKPHTSVIDIKGTIMQVQQMMRIK